MDETTPPEPTPAPARVPAAAAAATARRRRVAPQWLLPAGLILLSLVPMTAGAFRIGDLATGPVVTEENARFVHSPIPIVVHIVGSSAYLVLGALQFAPSLRRRRWHRIAGRIALPAGLASALSALWMTVFFVIPPPAGPALAAMRLVLGTVMIAGLVTAFLAIRRGDVPTHRAWMIRSYAIGIAAGTQVFTFLPWTLLVGEAPGPAMHAALMGAGWVLNLVVAEIAIRRGARRSGPRARGIRARAPRDPGRSAAVGPHLS